MKKIIVLMVVLVCIFSASADVNITANVNSDGGEIDFWANANSGIGITNYYLDGVNYKDTVKVAANSRGSIVSRVYKAFMQWKLQPTGEFAWQDTDFSSLESSYQKLRYVLESWFVPRAELVQVINRQQEQINQLNLEIEAIGKVIGEEEICEGRISVMLDRDLPSVVCGNRTIYKNGMGIEVKE